MSRIHRFFFFAWVPHARFQFHRQWSIVVQPHRSKTWELNFIIVQAGGPYGLQVFPGNSIKWVEPLDCGKSLPILCNSFDRAALQSDMLIHRKHKHIPEYMYIINCCKQHYIVCFFKTKAVWYQSMKLLASVSFAFLIFPYFYLHHTVNAIQLDALQPMRIISSIPWLGTNANESQLMYRNLCCGSV